MKRLLADILTDELKEKPAASSKTGAAEGGRGARFPSTSLCVHSSSMLVFSIFKNCKLEKHSAFKVKTIQ